MQGFGLAELQISLVVGALIVVGALTFRSVPSEFTPAADVGRVSVSIEAPEGTSFDHM